MDRVCSQILGLEDDGSHHFFADYSQYERYIAEKKPSSQKKDPQIVAKPTPSPKKLAYKEQKELDGMEEAIAQTEEIIKRLQKGIETSCDHEQTLLLYQQLGEAQKKLDLLFDRWQCLENKR
jgi:ATP-binding cassette subfamily F protein uup